MIQATRIAAVVALSVGLFVAPGAPANAWASTTCFAYVTDFSSDDMSVIDTAANTVTTTIGVGAATDGLAIACAAEPEPPVPPGPTPPPVPTPATSKFTG